MPIIQNTYEKEIYKEDGTIIGREVTTDSVNIHKNEEGTYVKIYLEQLDNLPEELTLSAFRFLVQLAKYASYADINDLEGGMLVQLNTAIREEIQEKLNIKRSVFYTNLKNLVDCDLIREIKKSCYQLNPNLLGKGYYEYRATYKQGGIKDLRESWNGNLKQQTVTVDDNKHTVATIKTEIEELDKRINESSDYEEKQIYMQEKQKWIKALKKLSDTEYTKIVEYTIQQNKEIESMNLEPPEGFGNPETDPFGMFV